MNTDELERQLYWAERRVREIQTKLHCWATAILIAGSMICTTSSVIPASCWWPGMGAGHTGARTAGVDGQTVHQVEVGQGVEVF